MSVGSKAAGALVVVIAGLAMAEAPRWADKEKIAEAIRPTAGELRWQQVPWVTDLSAGQRLAQAEKRPIFLWVTGDDPLERC